MELLKCIYKNTKNLEVKRNLLHLMINKYLSLGLYSEIDYITENILNDNGFKCRYGRNYNTAIFEI